jgi:catechol 2,3-dioxygenase-like lactoylglutathione lyase family enzyme
MTIQYKSAVLFVQDMQASRHFYEDVLGQKVEVDFGTNVGYVGGFAIWQADRAHEMVFGGSRSDTSALGRNNVELYFETADLAAAWEKIDAEDIQVAHPITEQIWGQQVFRIHDPDGHIVEIGEPIPVFVKRFLDQGLSIEETSKRTFMPIEAIQAIANPTPVES